MRFCPDKKCTICGLKGHPAWNCQNKFDSKKKKAYQISDVSRDSELSVALTAKLNDVPFTVLLDSGARPSVLDLDTVRKLGLESSIHRCSSKIYGVGKNPIGMVGNISISVDMGDDQKLVHSFGILHEANPTRILGRDFLRRLGPTEFD